MNILQNAVSRFRSTLCVLLLLLVAGVISLRNMPIEANPEIHVPYVSVQVTLDGISPEDGARLLIRPIEQQLRSINGVEEITATSRESLAYIMVKFEVGEVEIDKALNDVRVAVDRAKAELPSDADEPIVEEITTSDFPAVTVTVTGDQVNERELFNAAQMLRTQFENLPQVLEANLVGHREEVVEAIINPARLEHYNITSDELINAVLGNNLLVPAGQIDTGTGRFAVKVPGLIEDRRDVFSLPVKSTSEGVVTLGDVADIRRTFKDPERFTTINGKRAIVIEVEKRSGTNQIDVSETVKALGDDLQKKLPAGIEVDYILDMSSFTSQMVSEMQGNIFTAMALVMVVVIAALGLRSGVLVGLGIPFSLLVSIIFLQFIGYTFNFMVMFGMLLALGMLIDGAIVVTEFADRKMAEGMTSRAAYQVAVRRMLWPVVASTATTLAAFLPLMFWPGVSGDFMGYLPVTVFAVLVSSLAYALFFAPVIGSLMGKSKMELSVQTYLCQLETDNPVNLQGITGGYARLLSTILRRPVVALLVALVILFSIFGFYGKFNSGVMFFTETEEKYGQVSVRAQGNLSVEEQRKIVYDVDQLVQQIDGVLTTYSMSGGGGSGIRAGAKDQIGNIMVELDDYEKLGRSSHEIFSEIREKTKDLPGIIVNGEVFEGGPPVGKPVQIQLESNNREKLLATARYLRDMLEANFSDLRDITDSTPLPGIEWEMVVDRALAAQMGVNVVEVGRAVQLVTNGVRIGDFRPDDAEEEVEIRVRYPFEARGINALDYVRVNTPQGPVPISSFVERKAKPRVDKIERIDSIEVVTVKADVQEGVLEDDVVKEVQAWLAENPLDPEINVVFRGANEEQEKASAFLGGAMMLALFLMFVLLVTQFNSFYQGLLIMSAVIMSTAGVLLGLLVTQQPLSIILTGVGIVALAGIVVNNNIVLIDTYNHVRRTQRHLTPAKAAVVASTQRLRPVFLTTATTILGMLPIAMNMSVDLMGRDITFGGVIASMYVPLARAIVYGLLFSTVLTLLMTPVMLVVPRRLHQLGRIYLSPRLRPLLERIQNHRRVQAFVGPRKEP